MFDILPVMTYPLRRFRAIAATHQERRPLSARQAEQESVILATATDMLIEAGRQNVTMGFVAGALRLTVSAVRRHFACVDDLLDAILVGHLNRLVRAILAVPDDSPASLAARRMAYRGAMLDEEGGMLRAHHLLLTQAATLPQDLREDIAAQREAIGDMLAPGLGSFALLLLDDPDLPLAEVEEHIALKAARLARQTVPGRREAAPAPARQSAAILPSRCPEGAHKKELRASTALQHEEFETSLARAGP
jgi:AcrR family transcriptional regulator